MIFLNDYISKFVDVVKALHIGILNMLYRIWEIKIEGPDFI